MWKRQRENLVQWQSRQHREKWKIQGCVPNYCFQPIAVENLGALDSSAVDFINTLGQRISSVSGEDKESAFIFQRISVTILQQYSVVRVFSHDDHDQ